MKITAARLIVCSPDRNFVTLKIETDEGIYGLGDATLNGRELAVASYLTEHVIPCIIGRDPFQTEDIWQYLYRGAYWRRGPVTMTAIAAVDVALWDIKGKALNTPVYNLLGGKSRDGVLVYAHANGSDITRRSTMSASTWTWATWRCVRRPASRESRAPTAWQRPASRTSLPSAACRLRTCGRRRIISTSCRRSSRSCAWNLAELHLLHDCHHRLTPIEAARLGKALEALSSLLDGRPYPAELQEGFKVIREHTTTPIAVGEVFNSVWDAHDLIRNQWIDYLRMTLVHGGGITHAEEDRRLCGALSRAHRISWSDRSVSGDDGRRAALRYCDPQLRHSGTHAAHALTDEVFPTATLSMTAYVSGRRAGAWRGSR